MTLDSTKQILQEWDDLVKACPDIKFTSIHKDCFLIGAIKGISIGVDIARKVYEETK